MNNNIRWLRDRIKMMDLQGIIISNPINIKYLTGIEAEGTFLVTPKENIYITDGRYVEAVNNTLTINDEIVVFNMKDLAKEDYENFFLFCEKVGFEENYVTYAQYKDIMHRYKINSLEETEGIIEKQRMIKDPEEIELITKACQITDACFNHLKSYDEFEKALQNSLDHLEKDGIMVTVTNNKKKSLVKSNVILNYDFPTELINKYRINESATIVNVKRPIKITQKRFNGVTVNDYEIEYRNDICNEKFFVDNL